MFVSFVRINGRSWNRLYNTKLCYSFNMKIDRGFVGVATLILIVLGLIVIGGGAYYVMHQNSASQTPQNYPNISTNSEPETGAPNNSTPVQVAPSQAVNNVVLQNTSTSFTVPSSITLTSGESMMQSGSANPVSIKLTDSTVADGNGSAEYCPNVVLSNGIAADRTVMICPDNPNYLPVLYGDLSILLTHASASQATFSVSATNNAPSATIDSSSLMSSSPNPTITGSAFNLKNVRVEIHANGRVYDAGNDQVTGSVPVSNNRWTGTFTQVSLSPGSYPIAIIDTEEQYTLASGTLTVTAQTTSASATFSASPTSGRAPLTVTFSNLPVTAAEVDLDFGDGTPQASDGFNGCWPVNGSVPNPCTDPQPGTVTHTYTKPGTYTAIVTGEMSEGQLGQVTITVTN